MPRTNYTSDEFTSKFNAQELDLVAVPCWILGIQSDHYVVSFEPVNSDSNSIVPFSIVDQVDDIGEYPYQGNGEVIKRYRQVVLFLKKPTTPDGSALFDILRSRETTYNSCPSCSQSNSPFQKSVTLSGSVYWRNGQICANPSTHWEFTYYLLGKKHTVNKTLRFGEFCWNPANANCINHTAKDGDAKFKASYCYVGTGVSINGTITYTVRGNVVASASITGYIPF